MTHPTSVTHEIYDPLTGTFIPIADNDEEFKVDSEETEVVNEAPIFDPSISTFDTVAAFGVHAEQQIESVFGSVLESLESFNPKAEMDILYVTSISFLIVFTIAIVSSLVSYRTMMNDPLKLK